MIASHIHFQSIGVVDMIRARDFYRDMLGFQVEQDNPYGETRWIFMALPGADTMLHFDQCESIPAQEKPALILATPDVDASCATLRDQGIAILNGPDDAPWAPGIRWAMIHDSEGNLLLLQTTGGRSNG